MEKKKIPPIPDGYTTVTPWIISSDAVKLIEFIQSAFGGEEIEGSRMPGKDGSIGHVEVKIGDAMVMLFDAPKGTPAWPAFMRLYVEDADVVLQKAIHAGGRIVTRITPLFFGDRVGRVADPQGNVWWIQQRIEDMTKMDPDKLAKKAQEPDAIDAMQYVVESLAEELRNRRTS